MSFGKYTYGRPRIVWENPDAKLVVGSFCSIANNVTVYLGGNHRCDWVTTFPFGHIHRDAFPQFDGTGHPATKGDVVIGNDVWIGDNVVIMSGVVIGDGAVIANNSHVVKSVEPYALVGGNPGQRITYRFTREHIDALLQIRWWEWDDATINRFTPLMCHTDIDAFIVAAKSHTPSGKLH